MDCMEYNSGTNCKQLLDEVFVISGIIKVEISVITQSRRLITLTETLIISDITKTESNNFSYTLFEENKDKPAIHGEIRVPSAVCNLHVILKQI